MGRVLLEDLDRIVAKTPATRGRDERGVLWDSNGIRLSHPTRPDLRFRSFEPLPPDIAARFVPKPASARTP